MKSFNARVALSEKISEEIQQWIENLMLSKRTTAISPPTQLIVTSVASVQSWRACCQRQTAGDPWTAKKQKNHTNVLELRTTKLAISIFTCMHPEAKSIRLQMDNIMRNAIYSQNWWKSQQSLIIYK